MPKPEAYALAKLSLKQRGNSDDDYSDDTDEELKEQFEELENEDAQETEGEIRERAERMEEEERLRQEEEEALADLETEEEKQIARTIMEKARKARMLEFEERRHTMRKISRASMLAKKSEIEQERVVQREIRRRSQVAGSKSDSLVLARSNSRKCSPLLPHDSLLSKTAEAVVFPDVNGRSPREPATLPSFEVLQASPKGAHETIDNRMHETADQHHRMPSRRRSSHSLVVQKLNQKSLLEKDEQNITFGASPSTQTRSTKRSRKGKLRKAMRPEPAVHSAGSHSARLPAKKTHFLPSINTTSQPATT